MFRFVKKHEDMQVRLDKFYDEIKEIETSIEAVDSIHVETEKAIRDALEHLGRNVGGFFGKNTGNIL